MQWKLTCGKWRSRLLNFVLGLDDDLVKSSSEKGFQSLPNVSKALSELMFLKGVGPATASAILADYALDVAPFMSDGCACSWEWGESARVSEDGDDRG
ncbi:hypothetical protein F8388_022820 [Cannabis sativa]|uniref:Uncharacterized protein n=1 Tax=Cannabis sativa TaxID=3483 RepID=A0A7J6FBV8_CANSA|nr:hypothetical protein F8388_022820 [Cannabis sativa]